MKITIKSLAVNLFAVLGAASISLGASGTERPFIIEYTQVAGGTTQSVFNNHQKFECHTSIDSPGGGKMASKTEKGFRLSLVVINT